MPRGVTMIPRTALPGPLADRWTPPPEEAFTLRGVRVTGKEAEEWRRDAQARLSKIDAQLDDLAERRKEIAAELAALERLCWPQVNNGRSRRRAGVDETPMPPIPTNPVWLWGRDLRAALLSILRRRGELSLREIEVDLRRRGFAVAGDRAHKTIADALGYEVRRGRAIRTKRGHYEPAPGHKNGAARPLRRRRRVCALPAYGGRPNDWAERRRWWRDDIQFLLDLRDLGPWPPDGDLPFVDSHQGVIDPRLRSSPWWELHHRGDLGEDDHPPDAS